MWRGSAVSSVTLWGKDIPGGGNTGTQLQRWEHSSHDQGSLRGLGRPTRLSLRLFPSSPRLGLLGTLNLSALSALRQHRVSEAVTPPHMGQWDHALSSRLLTSAELWPSAPPSRTPPVCPLSCLVSRVCGRFCLCQQIANPRPSVLTCACLLSIVPHLPITLTAVRGTFPNAICSYLLSPFSATLEMF